MNLIWGDFINFIRDLHLEQAARGWSLLSTEEETTVFSRPFQFPKVLQEEFFPWDEREVPENLLFHPVERLLLEGPLLPQHCIHFGDSIQIKKVIEEILFFEREYIQKNKTNQNQLNELQEIFSIQTDLFLKRHGVQIRKNKGLSLIR